MSDIEGVVGDGTVTLNQDNALDYLSTERYQSPYATVTELVSNAWAGIDRAVEEHRVDYGDLQIRVEFDGETFAVEDDGIGVASEEFKSRIETAANLDMETRHRHKYGIGLLSARILGDTYRLHTKTLHTDEQYSVEFESFEGAPKFTEIPSERVNHGTRVEVDLEAELDADELVDHVEELVDVLPVDVAVVTSGKVAYFEASSLVDEAEYVHYDDEHITVVSGGEHTGQIFVNGFPVQSYQFNTIRRFRNYPSVHIKRNDGYIVDGPNEGKLARENEVVEGDVPLPETTSDRERVKEKYLPKFESWVAQVVEDDFRERAINMWEDCLDISDDPLPHFYERVHSPCYREQVWEDIDDEMLSFALRRATTDIHVVDASAEDPSKASARRRASFARFMTDKIEGYDQIYMGKTINKRRAKIVGEIEGAGVVSIYNRNGDELTYDEGEKFLGWELLKEVPLDEEGVREFGVEPDDLDFDLEVPGLNVWESGSSSMNVKPEDIEDLDGPLYLFPRHKKPNVTDYRGSITVHGGYVASVTTSQMEVALEASNAIEFEEDPYPPEQPEVDGAPVGSKTMVITDSPELAHSEEFVDYVEHESDIELGDYQVITREDLKDFAVRCYVNRSDETIYCLEDSRNRYRSRARRSYRPGRVERFEEYRRWEGTEAFEELIRWGRNRNVGYEALHKLYEMGEDPPTV